MKTEPESHKTSVDELGMILNNQYAFYLKLNELDLMAAKQETLSLK